MGRERNSQKSVMHVQNCCFPMHVNRFFFLILSWRPSCLLAPSEPMETINNMSSVFDLRMLSVRLVSSPYSGRREYLEH